MLLKPFLNISNISILTILTLLSPFPQPTHALIRKFWTPQELSQICCSACNPLYDFCRKECLRGNPSLKMCIMECNQARVSF